MVVETYVEDEKKEFIPNPEQWRSKAEELGLQGQLTLADEGKSPIPFKYMDTRLKRVLETLLPSHVEVEAYDKEPIPMEVMSLVALAKKENYFKGGIHVMWSDAMPDPAVVGQKDGSYWSISHDLYLIGRWGPEKVPFEVLEQRAFTLWKANTKSKLEDTIAHSQGQLASLDAQANKHFAGEFINVR